MQLSSRNTHLIYALLISAYLTSVSSSKRISYQCPLGFKLATSDGVAMCYRLKDPEVFADKYKDCTGNLFSSKLYFSLKLPKTNKVLWTEYKSAYPGGPYTDSFQIDEVVLTADEVKHDSSLQEDEDQCVVIDPVSNITATRCDEKHYRYCFVEPYPNEGDLSRDGCLPGYWRFFSPYPTCLSPVTGVGGGTIRATWRQALEICLKRGASLPVKGWRYTNHPLLHVSGSLPIYPLGIVKEKEDMIYQFDAQNATFELSSEEWYFEDSSELSHHDQLYGAIRNEFWHLVNSSFVFFDVICEQSFALLYISLELTNAEGPHLRLEANDTIHEDKIICTTDSVMWYPTQLPRVKRIDAPRRTIFEVPFKNDGYYYCTHSDFNIYHPAWTEKVLFIESEDRVVNLYSVTLHLKRNKLLFDDMEKNAEVWKKKLAEFIFFRTRYLQIYKELPVEVSMMEEVLRAFKKDSPHLEWKDAVPIFDLKIKRVNEEARVAVVHIQLNPEMIPPTLGSWGLIDFLMKPAYFCPEMEPGIPRTQLGNYFVAPGCREFTCVGDFNNGVQWIETATDRCTTTPRPSDIIIVNITTPSSTAAPQPVNPLNKLKRHNITWPSNEEREYVGTTTSAYNETWVYDINLPGNRSYNETLPDSGTEMDNQITTPDGSIEYPDVIRQLNDTSQNEMKNNDNRTSHERTPKLPTTPGPPSMNNTTEPPCLETDNSTSTMPPILTSSSAPEEQLQIVLDELQGLLQNDTVSIASIDRPFDQVDQILEADDTELQIPSQLLHLLDELASRVVLPDRQALAVRNNVAILMADADPENPVRGIRVAARDNDKFTESSFGFIDGKLNSTQLFTNKSEAVVFLPASVSATPRRISFVAFRNQRAFQSDLPINSRVFSVNVENLTQFDSGEVIDIHLSPIVQDPARNQSRVCAFWKFTGTDADKGYWSQEGCELIRSTTPGTMDTCRCTHLTHFAEILVPRNVFSEADEKALEVLTVIGCIVSIVGLLFVALTASMFRSWRRDYSNKIWLQLCIAIFILVVCFLVVVFSDFKQYTVPCMLVGVALHYSLLASFCWMLVAAVLSYRRLVLVFTRDMSHKLLRASAFAWGTPCAIVGILLAINPKAYQRQFGELTPNGNFCYPSDLGLWLAVYTPVAIMVLANWILFGLIVRSVFASRRIQRHGDSNEALRCASVSCLLVFLFGLPWIFGLFAFNVVMAYLFTLLSAFQGFVLFVFFVLGNKKTRDLWLNKLKIKQTRKIPVTSSTYTNNRSTGPGWRGGPEGATSIEAKTSKPRSLTSPDDSRFS